MRLVLVALPALLAIAIFFAACHQEAPPKAPCDAASLAAIVVECSTRIEAECASKNIPESDCAVLKECDARLDSRAQVCR